MDQNYFFGAPSPYPTESFSSWFHRFCQQQGIGFQRALDYFQIPPNRDLDYEIDHSILQKVVATCSIAQNHLKFWQNISRTIQRHRAVRKKLWVTPKGEATTAFCTDCLQSEVQPYLRIEWRFEFWKICPFHQKKLDHVCRNCSNQIILEKSILTAATPPPNLNYCKYCLTPFSSRIPTKFDLLAEEEIETKIKNQRALMATILHGYGHVAPLKARVTPTVLIRLLDANLISTAINEDFEEDVPIERAKYLKTVLQRFKKIALKMERRKNWKQIKEREIERRIRHRPPQIPRLKK
jgi:hypothetical protein